ncbi:MAG: tRNA preQ1(34) S-adenosylmethionine ribosyltransferase-isomerase QueA [bacterium]|nr:tRNA preQ1(34) S-adenosylmethionine ribosyltransferase-isomerase QueA [bacterium]
MHLLLSDFDYHLPKELIAQFPPEKRGQSRLLVYHRDHGRIEHRQFPDLLEYLHPTDILVVNDSKVIPARLWATEPDTGKQIELLLIHRIKENIWSALTRPAKRCQPGVTVSIGNGKMQAKIINKLAGSRREIEFTYNGDWNQLLAELGEMPVPPYIKRNSDKIELKQLDKSRYQTIYAKYNGSIAAPTAGLHFSEELLQKIQEKGVQIVAVTLHVGPGTFQPVRTERIADHKLEPEYYLVPKETAEIINTAKRNKQRIVVVGTTATRTLETVADENGLVHPKEGWAGIFIYPGYEFKIVDILLTNFHLPQSTLLMLVSAFAGKEKILQVYQVAIREKYRFYSYGDAMLIL